MRIFAYLLTALMALSCALSSCSRKVGMTTVAVKDSLRHYYPVLTGQVLNLAFELENTGDTPLVIRDIQASCGCIEPKLDTRMVLPGKKVRLEFKYESAKNIGYVEHIIRIHGNILPNGICKLIFDTNVVPNSDYTRDYEELYKEAVERSDIIRGAVDGDPMEKGYWTETPAKDSRSQKRFIWRQNSDR